MKKDGGHLYVHIGPPKTGTSAVQHVLREHDNSALIYPKVGLWWDGSHHDLIYNFFPDLSHPKSKKADIADLFSAIAAEAGDQGRNIVISSEVLWGLDVGSFVRALRPYIGNRKVEVLVTCREHFSLATSMYAHCVKDPRFGEKNLPGDYLARAMKWLTYSHILGALPRDYFPVRVLNYHPVESFVTRFLEHVGFPLDAAKKIESRNPSLSVKGMIAGLSINRVAADDQERAACFQAVETISGFYAPASGIFDGASVSVLRGIFLKDAEYLDREFGVQLPARNDASQDSFFINRDEFDEIQSATRSLGVLGKAVADEARRFCLGG